MQQQNLPPEEMLEASVPAEQYSIKHVSEFAAAERSES